MAKNGTVQNPLPFRDRFTKWLIDEGYTKESAGSYASYINKSLNSKVLRRLSRNGISAFDAYPASLSFDDLLQITSRYLDLISDSAISFEIDPGTLAKCRSALLAYVEYLYIHKDNLKEKFPDCQVNAVITDYIPEEYSHASMTFTKRILLKNFSFRLATQNRISGEKVWLPLGLIRMIFTKTKEKNAENYVDHWAEYCAKGINIYINGFTDPITLDKIKSLMINPESGNVEIIKGNTRFVVQTPTSNKRGFKPMYATCLRNIHIDHSKAIDKILKDESKAEQLPTLQTLKDWLLKAQVALGEKLSNDNKSTFFNHVLNNHSDELQGIAEGLKAELDLIAEWQVLQLMGAKENSHASNKC